MSFRTASKGLGALPRGKGLAAFSSCCISDSVNHPDYRRTPVVVFSSSTRDDDQVKPKALGANEFLAKPSSGMKFGEVLEELRGKWLAWKRT